MTYQPQDYTCLFEWSHMVNLSHLRETCSDWKKIEINEITISLKDMINICVPLCHIYS